MAEMLCIYINSMNEHTYCSDILNLEGMVDLQLLVQELLSPQREEEGRSCRYIPHTDIPC